MKRLIIFIAFLTLIGCTPKTMQEIFPLKEFNVLEQTYPAGDTTWIEYSKSINYLKNLTDQTSHPIIKSYQVLADTTGGFVIKTKLVHPIYIFYYDGEIMISSDLIVSRFVRISDITEKGNIFKKQYSFKVVSEDNLFWGTCGVDNKYLWFQNEKLEDRSLTRFYNED